MDFIIFQFSNLAALVPSNSSLQIVQIDTNLQLKTIIKINLLNRIIGVGAHLGRQEIAGLATA